MKEMTELKMVYELVISRANPLDNPRYELLNQAQRKMKDKILNVIRKTNPNYPEMDYDDDVFKYIVQFNDEYCIDAFAKGISFALNFKEQAERFMNKKGMMITVKHYVKDGYINTDGIITEVDNIFKRLRIVRTYINYDDIDDITGEDIVEPDF